MDTKTTNIERVAKEVRNAYMRDYKRNMSEEQKQKHRDYQKQWRRRNPEKTKQHQENYWIRKAREQQRSK